MRRLRRRRQRRRVRSGASMRSEVVGRVERRRRWSDGEKLAVVMASLEPDAVVATVARRFCLYCKVPEKGRFPWPSPADGAALRLTSGQISMLCDQPGFAEPDTADEFLEATAMRGGRAAQAEIGVDHVDIGFMPPEVASALAQRVLEPRALLIAHHLMGRRLPDVGDGPALQMRRLDKFGHHERSPPEPWRYRRRSVVAGLAATSSIEPRAPCS